MKQNKFGVLLAISSLPGNHGIGDFGRSAYEFVDFLKEKDINIGKSYLLIQ